MNIDPKELKQRYQKRLAGIRDKKVYIGPETVTLDLQNICNLTCRFCGPHVSPDSEHKERDARYFRLQKFVEIVKDCVDLNVDQIEILGGEPTYHPYFKQMIKYLQRQPIYARLWTNATFPMDYCSEVSRVDHIMVNLSAVNRQKYLELKRADLFDQVVANIRHLVSLRDSVKPDLKVDTVYVVNKLNADQQEEMKKLTSQLGVNAQRFIDMDVSSYNIDIASANWDLKTMEPLDKRTPELCLNGWFNIIIKLDGKISTCSQIREMPLGNMNNMTFKEFWHSQPMDNIRLLGRCGGIQKRYQVCRRCIYYDDNVSRTKDAAIQ